MFDVATRPGHPDRANEDWIAVDNGPHPWAVLLDGAGGPAGLASGCTHTTPWYVQELGAAITSGIHTHDSLTTLLGEAINHVAHQHGPTCDLAAPGPSATVVILRHTPADEWDYLVLCDSTLVIDDGRDCRAVTDTRIEAIAPFDRSAMADHPIGSETHQHYRVKMVQQQRKLRNHIDGYWVAAATPDAAHYAHTGTTPITRAALLTDGAARWAEWRIGTWSDLLTTATTHGPHRIIDDVREREHHDPNGHLHPRAKATDDATIALYSPPPNAAPNS